MLSKPSPPTVLLLGDSHANHLYSGLSGALPGESVLSIGACTPTVGLVYPEPKGSISTCANENFEVQSRFLNERVITEPSLKRVFMSAMWRSFDERGDEIDYWSGERVTTFRPTEPNPLESYLDAIGAQIDRIAPELPITIVLYTPRRGLSLELQRQRQAPLRAAFEKLHAQRANVTLFDPMARLCNSAWCRWDLLSDANHLSRKGSGILAEDLAK